MDKEWELITYDLWGNESDGFEVNQSFKTGKTIEFSDSITDKELEELAFNEFGLMGIIDSNTHSEFTIYFNDPDMGHPLFELRLVQG